MSVYTPQSAYGQQTTQSPLPVYGQVPPAGLSQGWVSPFPQAAIAAVPQAYGQLPLLVSDLSTRCASISITALVEQMRIDPQILTGIQLYGQIPAQVWGNVLVEVARRVAPVLHSPLAELTQQGRINQFTANPSLFGATSHLAGFSAPMAPSL
ncbi:MULTISPECIES: hypothetical protein [Streptomyces]|uniref:hypothetical protein n=1 Tax=Streptomyces TaxID=1883 RepID=UPI00345C0F91